MVCPCNTIQVRNLLRRIFRPARRLVPGCICFVLAFTSQACNNARPPAPRITLTLIDQSWVDEGYQRSLGEELRLFTSRTGIPVQVLPGPEGADEQLITSQKLLESESDAPDVYAIDVIWPGILAKDLLDLKPYVPAQEIAAHFPELIANNTVNGRLVALPFNMNEGMLFYRVDLLKQYGYRNPPKTWQELETMAARIQSGERAKGNKDFWGFVWEGAPSEALTCNALEWQASEGGGMIVDANGRSTVNNPNAIRSWERAARWVGAISPPGIIAYKEWDALNSWKAGNAAFMRNWASAYAAANEQDSIARGRFDLSPLPKGQAGPAATLGGKGYGVARRSRYPQEAATLVRFLTGRDEQLRRSLISPEPPSISELYSDPEVLAHHPQFSAILLVFRKAAASRPSTFLRNKYPQVSSAYFQAVHAVLAREKSAPQAAAELQGELAAMLKAPATSANAALYQGTAASQP